MPKLVSASNAVMASIEQASAMYGVRSYRMQSRVFKVPGAGGRERPMFIGQWKDELGVVHFRGMTDMLLAPVITFRQESTCFPEVRAAVLLWVECKSGTGRLTEDQILFRDDVLNAGHFWIQARDSAESVIEWFKHMGVRR